MKFLERNCLLKKQCKERRLSGASRGQGPHLLRPLGARRARALLPLLPSMRSRIIIHPQHLAKLLKKVSVVCGSRGAQGGGRRA